MPTRAVAQAFDQISPVYDSTRDQLDAGTLETIATRLREKGVRSILEVGVGTGRVALPLVRRGFEVTGIDVSSGMLAVARSKGLSRLVRGSAYRLPFRDREFDTALFVHVLHLLDDVPTALNESSRVARLGAMGLVHPETPHSPEPAEGADQTPRRIFFEQLAKEGYPPRGRGGGPRAKERELLRDLPPESLEVVSDREVTEPLARRLDMFEHRASRHTLDIPPDVLRRAAAAARAALGDRTVTYRRVEALATWSRAPYPPRFLAPTDPKV